MRKVTIWTVIIFVPLIAKVIHWQVINALPPGRLDAPVAMPSPNGFDYFLQAEVALARDSAAAHVDVAKALGMNGKASVPALQAVVDVNQRAFALIDQGMKYPAVAPQPRFDFDAARQERSFEDRDRLFLLLSSDAQLSQNRMDWPEATAKWLYLMHFADHYPTLGPQYDWGALRWRAHIYSARAFLKITPHLDGAQTRTGLEALESEYASMPSDRAVWVLDKNYGDQALLALFRDREWRGKWFRDELKTATVEAGPVLPVIISAPLINLRSDKTYLAIYDQLMTEQIALGAFPQAAFSDPFLASIAPQEFNTKYMRTQLAHAILQAGLQAYRYDHGNYPLILNALVPKYLAAIPESGIDIFSYEYLPTASSSGAQVRGAAAYIIRQADENQPGRFETVVHSP